MEDGSCTVDPIATIVLEKKSNGWVSENHIVGDEKVQ
jgi:hypothetical protein